MESSYPSETSHVPKTPEEENSPKAHEKYKKIISTLPRLEKATAMFDETYQYEGFWCPAVFLEGIMAAQEHFMAQPTDIVVSSAPKSGATWLKALTFAIVTRNRFDHSTSPLLTTVPHECIPFLEVDLVLNPTKRDPGLLPLLATHIPYPSLPKSITASCCKIVYIFRDPKDAFVSYWHFVCRLTPKDRKPIGLEEAFELFTKGINSYGPYWDHVIGYWKASLQLPERVLFLKYEDLKRDSQFYVKKLADFIGHPFSSDEEKEGALQKIINLCSFENLSSLDVNKNGKHRPDSFLEVNNNTYFRKGKTGDWENHLTAEMAEEMDRITKHKFDGCGLIHQTH